MQQLGSEVERIDESEWQESDSRNVPVLSKTPSVSVQEDRSPVVGSKAWSSRTRKRAKELARTLDTGYMELARILFQVYDTPIEGDVRGLPVYTQWGYSSFQEYAQEELGMHPKKAMRLRQIWFILEVQLGHMPLELKQRIVDLGMSKVRELVRVLTLRNADEWVSLAEKASCRQLETSIRDELQRQGIEEALLEAGESPDSPKELESSYQPEQVQQLDEVFRRESFELAPQQRANVLLALERASELSHSNKRGHNLDLICLDYLATNDFMGGDVDKRLRYVAKLERTLGLRLVVVDPKAKDILYGIEALKLVSEG